MNGKSKSTKWSMIARTFLARTRGSKEVSADLTGKTVVFTGGTDGMGRTAVDKLAKMGAHLILLGRDEAKTNRVVDELNRTTGNHIAAGLNCDLASQRSVRKCAEEILELCPRIDLLINCAGANHFTRKETEDGFEFSWAVNHLGPFLLTNLLLDRIKSSAPARIVNLSSDTQSLGHMDFDNLQQEKGFDKLGAYAQAKLAMIMWTRKLSKELEGTGVTVNALNPGFINTNLLRDSKGLERVFIPLMSIFASPPEVGANRIISLAVSPEFEGVTGEYVNENNIGEPNSEALDDSMVARVWEISRNQVGV